MKKLIAVLSMLALLAAAGGAGAQDKDKAPEKAAAEAKAEPAKAEAKKEEAKGDAKKEAAAPEEKKEEAKPAPVPNKGDVAWMLASTALVLMMSVPALALFYGGMGRSKNALSMLIQGFVGVSLVTGVWCLHRHNPAFTHGNAL